MVESILKKIEKDLIKLSKQKPDSFLEHQIKAQMILFLFSLKKWITEKEKKLSKPKNHRSPHRLKASL